MKKSILFAALAFLGLVCTEHGQHSSQIRNRFADPGRMTRFREHLAIADPQSGQLQ